MRSITFISVGALIAGTILAPLLGATPLFAQSPEGCWARAYSDAHLAKHPAQVVENISISFDLEFEPGRPWIDVQVDVADQGHAAGTGQGGNTYGQSARCFEDAKAGTGWSCSVECDGGIMRIDRLTDAEMLVRLETFWMGTGDDCGGPFNLAEVPGQTVAYKLFRQPAALCEPGA
ncbi:MAG: hypothetical protein AAF744_12830 [Pseudomonadota bacterium]